MLPCIAGFVYNYSSTYCEGYLLIKLKPGILTILMYPICVKIIFVSLIIFVSFKNIYAQVQDDFSDGNFTNNPSWTGDDAKFEVNATQQLHLNAPAITDTASLGTANTAINSIEWDFYFKLDFSPSSSNYLKVYLVSDQPNFKQPLNGYFLKMGEDGSNDAIDLYLQQGTTETLIVPGIDGHVSASVNTVSVKVTRDDAGNWSVFSDITGGTNYTLEGSGTDNTITATNYFGFFCKYTSTRSTSFYFDNVYVGPPVVDTEPPHLSQVTVISSNQLDVLFSEPLETNSSQNVLNYTVNNSIGNPSSAIQDINPALVHLTFGTSFPNGITNTLSVSNITDLAGNSMSTESANFIFYEPQKNDVLINEIMADPDPTVALPSAEFVELFNQSDFPLDLNGWTFSDGTTTQTLPSFILQPDSFLILCDDGNAGLLSSYGDVVGVTSFPSLNNDGDVLTLYDAIGKVINTVTYSSSWYHDDVKAEGGWTLELIDPLSPCTGSNNWTASNDPSGGTPGRKNSVFGSNPDTTPPELIRAAIINSTTIQLVFSESLDSIIASDVSHYQLQPANTILTASPLDPDFTVVEIALAGSLDSNTVYTIVASGITDCSGNMIDSLNSTSFAIPATIGIGDILINEILFNPKSGGYDYLEINNNTEKIFDLKDLKLASTDENDSLTNVSDVVTDSYLFFPGQYIVLSENVTVVKDQYTVQNPQWLIETNLPSFNDDEGVVVLVNNSGMRIDQLHYSETWQFPLIDDVEGVALERIHFDSPTQDSLNWHSAASTVGYGTPTYKNSQSSEPNAGNEITLSPQVFSPDEDGYNDILNITYKFDQAGYTANIKIYDAEGRQVKDLLHNALLSQSGVFTWDGITDNNEKAAVGMYIVYSEIFDLTGTTKHYKKVCVVAGKKS